MEYKVKVKNKNLDVSMIDNKLIDTQKGSDTVVFTVPDAASMASLIWKVRYRQAKYEQLGDEVVLSVLVSASDLDLTWMPDFSSGVFAGLILIQLIAVDAAGTIRWLSNPEAIRVAQCLDPVPIQEGEGSTWDKIIAEIAETSAALPAVKTIVLLHSGWSSKAQTVSVSDVTASTTVVFIASALSSESQYQSCGVRCVSQGAGVLGFSCDTVPSSDLTIRIQLLQ